MEPLTKQLKIEEIEIISKTAVDKAILRFIVYSLQTFSLEFKDLIHEFQPDSVE